jgi:phosphoglycolate phosphatase-like HAD superfamily hydrolase
VHIIWDWNGTLFDDHDLVVASVNASLQSIGVSPIDSDYYRSNFVRPLHLFYERLLGRHVDSSLMAEIDETFHDSYRAGFESAELAPDAAAAMEAATRFGMTQSVASMLWHDLLVSSVRRFGIDGQMIAVDGHRGPAGETKARHMVDHVLRLGDLFGIESSAMVVVGDITDDADSAASAGVACVLYDGGSQHRSALEATGCPVVDSLTAAVDAVRSGLGG